MPASELEDLIVEQAKQFKVSLNGHELAAYVKPLKLFDLDWVKLAFDDWGERSDRWPHQQRIRAIIQRLMKPEEPELTAAELANRASMAAFTVVASSRGIYPEDKGWDKCMAQWDTASIEQRAAWRSEARQKNMENRERRLGR